MVIYDYDIAYVVGDSIVVSGDSVTIEYSEETEYTNNELLMQINDNIVNGFGFMSGLIGVIVGFMAAKELLKIWLT